MLRVLAAVLMLAGGFLPSESWAGVPDSSTVAPADQPLEAPPTAERVPSERADEDEDEDEDKKDEKKDEDKKDEGPATTRDGRSTTRGGSRAAGGRSTSSGDRNSATGGRSTAATTAITKQTKTRTLSDLPSAIRSELASAYKSDGLDMAKELIFKKGDDSCRVWELLLESGKRITMTANAGVLSSRTSASTYCGSKLR